MNSLCIFRPTVFRILSDNVFDRILSNDDDHLHFSSRPYTNIIKEDDRFFVEIALQGFTKEQINMKYH